MTEPSLTPQQIAEAVAVGMMANDRASRGLGLKVTHIGPGTAQLEMTVRDDMLNGFDICHGGYITLLADSTFAFACNSYNELTVASSLAVDFIAPGRGCLVALHGRRGRHRGDLHHSFAARRALRVLGRVAALRHLQRVAWHQV